ncbi:BrnA antitoxin family protein [bacterium]|nr:BrnA antitoxin family protein [bacterium]
MNQEINFSNAAKRALFGKSQERQSAAKDPDRHLRVKVTMNLDGDIVRFFKEQADEEGLGYQVLINRALREFIDGGKPAKLAQDVIKEILANPELLAQLRGTE